MGRGVVQHVLRVTGDAKQRVLDVGGLLGVIDTDVDAQHHTAWKAIATATGHVGDGGVDEGVVGDDDQFFLKGEDLGGKHAHGHDRPFDAVDHDAVAVVERSVKGEHEGVHDVPKRVLNGQTDDDGKHGQGREHAGEVDRQLIRSEHDTNRPDGTSGEEDEQRVGAFDLDVTVLLHVVEEGGEDHLDGRRKGRGGDEDERGVDVRRRRLTEIIEEPLHHEQGRHEGDAEQHTAGHDLDEVVVPRRLGSSSQFPHDAEDDLVREEGSKPHKGHGDDGLHPKFQRIHG